MKPITNVLLIAAIISYVFLPLFNISMEGGWTGFTYTAETISSQALLVKKLFCLIPFLACFGGIALNCMKNRFWGIAVSVCIGIDIYFYVMARSLHFIESPQPFNITGLGFGFNIAYGLLIAALASALVSLLPFKFNRLHEITFREMKEMVEKRAESLHHKSTNHKEGEN